MKFEQALFFWINFFRLSIITHGSWKTEEDCSKLPENFVRVREGSKFLRTADFAFRGGSTVATLNAECKKYDLISPGVAHIVDFRTLQFFARDFVKKMEKTVARTLMHHVYLIALNERYDVAKDEVLQENGKVGFALWESSDPEPLQKDFLGHQMQLNQEPDGRWFLGQDDIDEDQPEDAFRVLCMFPYDTHCYKTSKEEKDFKVAKEPDRKPTLVTLMTYTKTGRDWSISSLPMSYKTAEKMCKSRGGKLWHGDEKMFKSTPGELKQLKDAVVKYLKARDFKPTSQFLGEYKGVVAGAGRSGKQYSFRTDGTIKISDYVKNANYLAICYEC